MIKLHLIYVTIYVPLMQLLNSLFLQTMVVQLCLSYELPVKHVCGDGQENMISIPSTVII